MAHSMTESDIIVFPVQDPWYNDPRKAAEFVAYHAARTDGSAKRDTTMSNPIKYPSVGQRVRMIKPLDFAGGDSGINFFVPQGTTGKVVDLRDGGGNSVKTIKGLKRHDQMVIVEFDIPIEGIEDFENCFDFNNGGSDFIEEYCEILEEAAH